MKLQSLLFPTLFSIHALASHGYRWGSSYCLTDQEAEVLIHNYVTTFEGIRPGGTLEEVQAVAMTTFASDIKMYSQSFQWLRGYKGLYDIYPPYMDGFEAFRPQFNHVYTPYKVVAFSHNCDSIMLAWQGNYTNLFGLNPSFGLTSRVDLAFIKPGTKTIEIIYSEGNSLQAAIATGGHVTTNSNLTECPRIF